MDQLEGGGGIVLAERRVFSVSLFSSLKEES